MQGLLVGSQGGTHIGGALLNAASRLGISLYLMESSQAYGKPSLVTKLIWRYCDKRPFDVDNFNHKLIEKCIELKPSFLLTTGCAPVNANTLKHIGDAGIKRINYLTDDPWNSAHACRWLFEALPNYDAVFSVRRANMENLKSLGCPQIIYLPFGYDSDLFYSEDPTEDQRYKYESDVLFVGGADKERLPYVVALIKAGCKVRLYGGYWDRFKETQNCAFGLGDPQTIRVATACTKIALCLVRRANRDDNCMRSFEIPAIGACMLAEDTVGHREVFGEDGQAVSYFKTPEQMLDKIRFLLDHCGERQRLASAAHAIIQQDKHTYQERLATMLRESRSHG